MCLVKVLKRNGFDIVNCNHFQCFNILSNINCRFCNKKKKLPKCACGSNFSHALSTWWLLRDTNDCWCYSASLFNSISTSRYSFPYANASRTISSSWFSTKRDCFFDNVVSKYEPSFI